MARVDAEDRRFDTPKGIRRSPSFRGSGDNDRFGRFTELVARGMGTPGFLLGLWHGFIFPVAWIVSLFTDKVAIYAVPNNGGWYDFGYFLGIVVFGVGARKSHTVYRDNVINVRARRIDE